MTITDRTFGGHLKRFALSVDILDDASFSRIGEVIARFCSSAGVSSSVIVVMFAVVPSEAVTVAGTAAGAIRALGPRRVGMAALEPAQALAAMAWVGAGGGAYGRRRGGPVGRLNAWWVVAALGDVAGGAAHDSNSAATSRDGHPARVIRASARNSCMVGSNRTPSTPRASMTNAAPSATRPPTRNSPGTKSNGSVRRANRSTRTTKKAKATAPPSVSEATRAEGGLRVGAGARVGAVGRDKPTAEGVQAGRC